MYSILLMIQYASIILLLAESIYVFMKWKTKLHGLLFLNCVATLINNMGYLMQMRAVTESEYINGLQTAYLGKVWIPLTLFLFSMFLCKIDVHKYVTVPLVFVHATIFILVMTMRYHNLYYATAEYVPGALFDYLKTTGGILHKIYDLFIFAYIVMGVFSLFMATCKENNPMNKKRLGLVTTAIVAESFFFVLNAAKVTPGYDLTVMGYSIGIFIMYIAIFRYNLLDNLQLTQDYVMDEINEGIIVADTCGQIEFFNEQARLIYPRISIKGDEFINIVKEKVYTGEPYTSDGRIYSVKEKKIIENDIQQGSLYVLVDETDEYKYMEELKEQKQIAEDANASKTAFLSVVSHEIRTPMNAVVGMTELLLQDGDGLSEKQKKYLNNIKNSGASLVMIVNDILDQSKIEAGKMEIVDEPYEPWPMLEDVRLIIENRIGSKPIELKYQICEDLPRFLIGDSLRIRQILINLMNNAVKFTEEGSITLMIKCIKEEDDKQLVRFSVKDTGQGIPPKELFKLGETFTQVDTKKNHHKEGTGLGLSISKNFIALMGGQLQVSSVYGKGSEFYFDIWQGRVGEESEDDYTGGVKKAWQEEAVFSAPDATVLIVDDTDVNLMIAEELLAPIKMNIDTANTGERAIELARSKKYDLIFMDYMMPYMDGIEATRKIRALSDFDGYYSKVPIIALSGDNTETTMNKFYQAGINDFAEKPVISKQLKSLLVKWLPKDMIHYQ